MSDQLSAQYTPTDEDVKTALDEWQWSRRMHIPEISTMDGDELHRNYLTHVTTKAKAEALREAVEKYAITIPDALGYKIQAVAAEDMLNEADQIEKGNNDE
ncbi:hypothetical protein [Nesterenkonia rhizosphaerae]|uniref:Uncharacterized protein n=1 Tax=Nesterenkonia rhizosphaerae TaxID=1348272 RepID=A0ABP9FZG2_9MICC